MQKDADAYRTISEVAETLDIPPHVLRFWETKFPQIKPLKRGGGRRYYRRNDTDLLRSIRRLLYDEGYTIRGVQRLLKAQGGVAALIQNQASPSANLPTADVQDDAADANPAGVAAEGPDKPLSDTISGLRSEIDACRAILQEAARAVQ